MRTVKAAARGCTRALAYNLSVIRQGRSFSSPEAPNWNDRGRFHDSKNADSSKSPTHPRGCQEPGAMRDDFRRSVTPIGAMLLALAPLVSPAANAQTYHVAVNGNDSNPGTSSAPFATLKQAQAAMRASGIKTATIHGGSYSLAGSSLTFDASDSGETWIPSSNEKVVLDGGGSGYVRSNGANNLTIEGLTFRNLGMSEVRGRRIPQCGLDIEGKSLGGGIDISGSGQTIRWNTFQNCSGNCLQGGGVTNSVIDSNTFDGQSPGNPPGQQYSYAYAAIQFWSSPNNNQITHNLIQNAQGGGISLTGDYNASISNNVVDRNIIRNINSNVIDSGAIYLIDTPHTGVGNRISNNIIDGYGGSTHQTNITKAFYIDNYASNVLIWGNIVRGVGTFAVQFHGGDHNWVINNVFDLSGAANQWDGTQFLYQDYSDGAHGMGANILNMNLIYFSGSAPKALWLFDIPGNDARPLVVNNLYWSATGASVPTDPDANPGITDPQFANPSAGDYSMPPASPAYTRINWTTLPTDQGPLPNPFQ